MRQTVILIAGCCALVACGGTEPAPMPDVAGVWRVTAVNGQPLPATTESGDTFIGGYLTLLPQLETQATAFGVEEHCAGTGSPQAFFNRLTWVGRSATLATFTYPDVTGAAFPVDSATVAGETMTWEANGAEGRLGSSRWELVRITHDWKQDAPPACNG